MRLRGSAALDNRMMNGDATSRSLANVGWLLIQTDIRSCIGRHRQAYPRYGWPGHIAKPDCPSSEDSAASLERYVPSSHPGENATGVIQLRTVETPRPGADTDSGHASQDAVALEWS